MKTPMKITSAILAVIVFGACIVNLPVIPAQSANAQTVPVPVIVNPVPKQYRVIDISRLPTYNAQNLAESFEKGLNDMGNQGWILVAVSGSYLIMMR